MNAYECKRFRCSRYIILKVAAYSCKCGVTLERGTTFLHTNPFTCLTGIASVAYM